MPATTNEPSQAPSSDSPRALPGGKTALNTFPSTGGAIVGQPPIATAPSTVVPAAPPAPPVPAEPSAAGEPPAPAATRSALPHAASAAAAPSALIPAKTFTRADGSIRASYTTSHSHTVFDAQGSILF